MVMEKALNPIIDLSEFPNSVVDVFIELPQTDAGSRCASICAASMALADAGIIMKDLVSAISVGRVEEMTVVDLDYKEEAHEEGPVADIPIAVIGNTGELTLLQMDGEIDKEMLLKAIKMGKSTCKEISEIQRAAIKDKYGCKK